AAPQLVADAEIGDVPRRLVAVLRALVRQRAGGRGHIFDPLGHLARGAIADVASDVRLRADLAQQFEELVRAARVGLGHATPVGVDLDRALGRRADAFAPVVFVGEAAAGPADHRDREVLERADDVVAKAVGIGDLAALAYPQATVDAVAEVLGELGEDF